jgi:hypothetical protein
MNLKLNEYKASGILLLLVCITIIVSGVFASMAVSLAFAATDIGNGLAAIAAQKNVHLTSIAFDLSSFILTVLLAGALYQVFGKRHEMLSRWGAFCLVASGVILSYHDIGNFILPHLAEDYVSLSGDAALAVLPVAKNVLLHEIWGVKIGYTYFSLGVMFFCCAMLMTPQFKRRWGYFGIFSAVVTLLASYIPLGTYQDTISMIAFLPMLIWEIAFGITLILTRNSS